MTLPILFILFFFIVLILIGAIAGVIAYAISRGIKSGQNAKAMFASGRVPPGIEKNVKKEFDNFVAPAIELREIVKNVGLFKEMEKYVYGPRFSKSTFYLYPIISWSNALNFRDPLVKCYSAFMLAGVSSLDLNNLVHYSCCKVREGLIESIFVDGSLLIRMNGAEQARLDFKNKKTFDAKGNEIGRFDCPSFLKLIDFNISGVNLEAEWKCELFIGERMCVRIVPHPSTIDKLVRFKDALTAGNSVDINLFQETNLDSTSEAAVVLATGLFLLGIIYKARAR